MGKFIDISGHIFSNLTVLYYIGGRDRKWRCLCDCGNETTVNGQSIRSGHTKSCGCLNKTHGLSDKIPEYSVWVDMKSRCYNVNMRHYKSYGGRGITVSKEWINSFETFYKDMGDRPTPKHSLDRKDNDKGYSKKNCKWATKREQANNRRSNVYIEKDGISLTSAEWARRLNISYKLISERKKRGFPVERILSTESMSISTFYTYNGSTLRRSEWLLRLDISDSTLIRKLKTNTFEQIAEKYLKEEYKV